MFKHVETFLSIKSIHSYIISWVDIISKEFYSNSRCNKRYARICLFSWRDSENNIFGSLPNTCITVVSSWNVFCTSNNSNWVNKFLSFFCIKEALTWHIVTKCCKTGFHTFNKKLCHWGTIPSIIYLIGFNLCH